MIQPRCSIALLAAVLAFTMISGGAASAQRNDDKKASLTLRAQPPVGFPPLKVRVTVDIRGGPDDAPDLYCPRVEWDWGDDLTSTRSADCPPYEAGKSTIERRYSAEHTYNDQGNFAVRFRLKQGSRVVANASTNVQVRDGFRDDTGF
jgi:hypothetical protein